MEKHILDQIALQWKQEEENFFRDTDYSEDYFKVDFPIGKKHAWQVEEHNVLKSNNLKALFDEHCRTEDHEDFVPWMTMYYEIMNENRFAPPELDLGVAKLYTEAKLTDIINGISGGGWLVSKRFSEILKNFNIGKYQEYKIAVKSKKIISGDYVYIHFSSYADEYVNFPRSVFYKRKGYFDFDSREILPGSFHSTEELTKRSDLLNVGIDRLDFNKRNVILSKTIVLNPNELDVFKFQNRFLINEQFISARLAQTILAEKITGFELLRTTKVK